MPVDTKRIIGPESSTPYRLYSGKNVKNFEQLRADVFDNEGLRKDKRKMTDLRDMFGRLGVVTQAKGSAYVEMGNTKVVASVYEPREIPKQTEFSYNGELFVEFKCAPFSCTNRCGLQPGSEERELASSVKSALEPTVLRHLLENFQVDIFIYVLENDGSVLATAINAAGLALADAEIPVYDIITAVTVGVQGDQTFVDPTAAEEIYCLRSKSEGKDDGDADHGIVVIAQLPVLEQIAEFWQHGALSMDRTLAMVDTMKPSCDLLYVDIQSMLMDKLESYLQNKKKIGREKKKENGQIQSL